jgi:aminopeptidase
MNSSDRRWRELGELLVRYSAGVKPGERVMIAMGEVESFPLVLAVYEAAVKAGAYPQVQFLSETLRRSLLKHGNPDQLQWCPEIEAYGMEWADVYFGLRGACNLFEHWDVSADRLAANQAAMGKISALRWQKTRWCLVRVPNAALAQQAETDVGTITDMFFNACLLDWPAISATWRRWAGQLGRVGEIRVVGHETDLRFSVCGRTWMVADGKINMPDGEILTSPVVESVDGTISFEFPGVLGGRLVNGIRLRWKDGRLVEATADSNQEFLRSVVATDEGAGLVGEFAIGTNPAVNIFCKDILIDEKIGGTIHIALGRAYPECGGTNQSAIHWDIIKDFRRSGTVYADGEPVMQNGRILL